ncbi:family helicase/ATPase-like protein [Calycina marina]|uniref:DNA helicase n=1 Tax=Calycina marina TaxID=1763456 RepID=A0A9P8CHE1_9HELO|nr:family helicase/ATPase-like protein [Calycina marina]
MAYNTNQPTPTSPAVKRQRTTNGYNSTGANIFIDDNDDSDDLSNDYVIPDTPSNARYETQPTQILDQNHTPTQPHSSTSAAPQSIVQVPRSSPIQQQPNSSSPVPQRPEYANHGMPEVVKYQLPQPRMGSLMAPAGTMFRPPPVLMPKTVISIDSDDDQKGASDDDELPIVSDIKPTKFVAKSPHTSFGSAAGYTSGSTSFQKVVNGAYYMPSAQTQPQRATPAKPDISIDSFKDKKVRDNITRLRILYPHITIVEARDALMFNSGSLDDAAEHIAKLQKSVARPAVQPVEPSYSKKLQPEMKRGLAAPIVSIKDRYSSTQQAQRQQIATTPLKPKRKLVRGRRNPSSSAIPIGSSPLKPSQRDASPPMCVIDDDTDSGIGSASEEDPELGGKVLKYMNTCTQSELVELTNCTATNATLMIAARPFKCLDQAREVANPATLKSGKKSTRAPVGDKIVDTAEDMFRGYEAIDQLVARCEQIGKPLAEEMGKWGFDVFGAAKGGELEMISLEDDAESLRDSGIGSPSSRAVSDAGDDELKVVSRKKSSVVNFLKKPPMMAEDCILKDYQVVGLNWLALMYRHKLSGILADEMGLGKTCQVIALLSHLVEEGHPGPHLVIVPGSTLENWLREFPKFSPGLVVEPYYGAQKERAEMADSILERRDEINVIVTTYDLAAKKEDNKFMRRLQPDVCVFDEGHYLKNLNSQRYQGLVRIPAKFKLLLTGTPLQNNLQELAALLAFILPDVFRERQEDLSYIFKAKATTRDADHAALLSAQRIARARSMLTPFVLRRKKAQVLKHLPLKTCRVEYCDIHPSQKAIYDGHIEQARERARMRVEGGRVPKSDENNPLMQLRKAAIHPLLFRRHFTNEKVEKMCDILRRKDPENFPPSSKRSHLIEEMRMFSDFGLHKWCQIYPGIGQFDIPDLAWLDSGKVESMVKLVKQYKKNGNRVLIFSQFALVLDILEAVLNSSLVHFTRIDGNTKIDERQTLIDTFRDDESITAFLLTTKAGGTGINLMYANKVIIFDGSFNPQDDRQAENRAHRVGQTRPVEVVRLVTRDTIEEQIFALGQSKLVLDGRVAGDEEGGGEDAGEKAVAKMLLESAKPVEAKDEADVNVEKTAEESTKIIAVGRKKASIIDLVTKKGKTVKPSKFGDYDDEMML